MRRKVRCIPRGRITTRLTTFEICLGVNTLVRTEGLAVGTSRSTGRESNIARHPLLPQIFRTLLLRGRARAARSVATNTVTGPFGRRALALVSGGGKTVCAGETTRVSGGALRERTVRIIALLPNAQLDWMVSKVTPSTSHLKPLTTSAVRALVVEASPPRTTAAIATGSVAMKFGIPDKQRQASSSSIKSPILKPDNV